MNLSEELQEIEIQSSELSGVYRNIFSEEQLEINNKLRLELAAWEYRVLEKISRPD